MIKVHEHTVEVVNKNDLLFEQLTMSNLLRHLERYAKEPHKYFEPLERSEYRIHLKMESMFYTEFCILDR